MCDLKHEIIAVNAMNISECAEIFISVFSHAPWSETWPVEKAFARLNDIFKNPKSLCLCCKCDGKIVAALFGFFQEWHTGFQYEIREFFVLKSHQKSGIGTAILAELESELSNKTPMNIVLQTLRFEDSVRFYKNNGFLMHDEEIFMYKDLT